MNNPQPIYLLPPDHPDVVNYRSHLDVIATQGSGMTIDGIDLDSVREKKVAMPQQIVVAAQHHPAALEALVFGISFGFVYSREDPTPVPEEVWKKDKDVMRWFSEMSGLLNMMFFLNDHEARFYCLAGDLMAEGKFTVEWAAPGSNQGIYTFSPEQTQQLGNRLYNISHFMLLYCHGTGVDARPYIEAVLADYDFPGLTYEFIHKHYAADVEKGIDLQARMY